MSDKEVDSSEDIQIPIEFTVLQSETKSFPVPLDQDVFFTNAELLNIQPDSANKIVTLSIDYEVFYFDYENNNEQDINQKSKNLNEEQKNDENNKLHNSMPVLEVNQPKKALDHITISIPVSSSTSSTSDSVIQSSSTSNQQNSSSSNPADNSFSSNFINQSYRYNSSINSNSLPIQIQFCPDMNPTFHVNGPADVRLTGFTAPTNYNLIDEEEESENDDNIIDENQNDNEKRSDIDFGGEGQSVENVNSSK